MSSAGTATPSPVAVDPQAERARSPLRTRLLLTAIAVEVAFVVVVLAFGAISAVAARSPALHEALHVRGLTPGIVGLLAQAMADAAHHAQPTAQLALDYGFSAFNLALALFLVWLRPGDRTAQLLAAGMAGTAAIFNLQAFAVYEALPPAPLLDAVTDAFHLAVTVAYLLALLLFPDGRVVPRWPAGRLALLYVPLVAAVTTLGVRLEDTSRTLALVTVFGLVAPAVGVAAQAYRFRRSPTPVERQQSRLLFWALTPALLLGLFVLARGTVGSASQTFVGRDLDVIPVELFRVFQPIFAIIPVALFVGILRFRLWNIDRVISRTLVYGFLAGFVSAVYVGVVVVLGRAIGTQGDNPLLAIVATGTVAVAFQPVKTRAERVANRLVYGRRATPYEVLATFSASVGATVATEEKLSRMARLLAEGTGARRADVWLVVGGEVRPAASWPEGADPHQARPLAGGTLPALGDATATVPVSHDGELLGALTVTKPGAESLSPTEEKLLADLGAQAGLVLRNVGLTAALLDRLAELRASRQRLVSAQDAERRRLERDLHDGAQQQLVALKLKLTLARTVAQGGDPTKAAALLDQLVADTDDAVQTLRELAHGIYPPLLAAEGLPVALASQARKAPLPVTVAADGVGRYPQDVEAAIYFCVLEALQNAAKYAGAGAVSVTLEQRDGWLAFTVHDDGCGFDPATTARGHGLTNLADRLDALGGQLSIDSRPGWGTTVDGRVPATPLQPS